MEQRSWEIVRPVCRPPEERTVSQQKQQEERSKREARDEEFERHA
jgi:hypothetical protein